MIPFRFGVAILAIVLTVTVPVRASDDLYQKVAASTAVIYTLNGPGAGGSGTGFLVDAQERLVVTARHVVARPMGGLADAVVVIFAQMRDGEIVTDAAHYRKNWQTLALRGKVVYDSVRRDMAILQMEKLPEGVRPLSLAARPARPGQTIHLVGNSAERFGGLFGYCQGYVRNVFRWEDMGCTVVTTQAPTNKGDSGGPLVNNLGEVLGLAAMSTTGEPAPKTSTFHDLQVTNVCICVSEIRTGLKEMREAMLANRENSIRPEPQSATVTKGQTKQAFHLVHMEKDALYRIRVSAKGFHPEARIDNLLAVPLVSTGAAIEVTYLYTAKETKEHRIQIGRFPGRDIGPGPFDYTLDVEQATFETPTTIKEPQLKLNEHARKFEAGKLYLITVRAKGFEPDVKIVEGTKSVSRQFNNGKRANESPAQPFWEALGMAQPQFETIMTFLPSRTSDYRILVNLSPFHTSKVQKLDYTVQIAEQKVELSVSDQLTAKDPLHPQAGPFKIHLVKLEANKTYQVDLVTSAFDSRLLLEDAAGQPVVQGFDAEGYTSRLVFRPAKTDTYRIIATAHQLDATGAYTLTVAENAHAQGGPPGGVPRVEMKKTDVKKSK